MQVMTSKGMIDIELNPDLLPNHNEFLVKHNKEIRKQLLAETDWIVTKSLESGEAVPDEWKQYRQALRDIPTQPDFPDSIEWPTKPE